MAGETPVGGDGHVDGPLSNFAVAAFRSGGEGLIGNQIFPEVPVGKQSDKYYTIDKDAFMRVPDTRRAPKTRARRVEFRVSSDAYFADNFALSGENALEDLSNADEPIQMRRNTTKVVGDGLLLDQEVRIANLITSIDNIGSGVALTGTDKWGDAVSSDPISDVTTGHAFIRENTGLIANTAIMDWDTWKVLKRHPVLLDRFKYTSGGELSMEQISSLFDVSRILIGQAIKNTAIEGGTFASSNVWGNNCILAHLEQSTALETVTVGVRMRWRPAGFPAPMAVYSNMEKGAGTRWVEVIESQYFQDEKIVAPQLAYAITGTL
jgi:hypothetical protein